MTERTKTCLADLRARQIAGESMPCPRCGQDTMKKAIHTNALSRCADIYICDQCGTKEAMLALMNNPLPPDSWACMIVQPDPYQPDTIQAYIETITREHIPFLMALYKRWLEEGKPEKYSEYCSEARTHCPGLGEMWTEPFQAEYAAKDGSRAMVCFRVKDNEIQYAVSVRDK